MIYLLDTHVLFWHLFEPARLSTASRETIAEGEAGKAGLIVLSIVLAELYYLLSKLQVDSLFPDIVTDLRGHPSYRIEPLVLEDVLNLTIYPRIPEMHDRLIVAASNRLGATLITKDQKIHGCPQVNWLW
jgi:PIN domain nuclease of toxin-antitoxin system